MNKLEDIKILTLKAITHIRSKNILKKLRFYEILFEMISKGIIRNKREIYYLNVPIFKSQKVVDSLIKNTCKELKETPFGLNITNTLKGIYYGEVVFYHNKCEDGYNDKDGRNEYDKDDRNTYKNDDRNTYKDDSNTYKNDGYHGTGVYDNDKKLNDNKQVHNINTPGATLIPDMNNIHSVTTPHKLYLIVEKDTIFSRVLREIKPTTDILVVCGKGYPCRNTLQFLSKLNKSSINLIGLFDYDPYGLDIFLKYRAVCPIELIGLKLEDLDLVPVRFHLELTERDKIRLQKLKEILRQANSMIKTGIKIEMENVFDHIDVLEYINLSFRSI